jgi:hypothetical protein
MFTLRRVPVTLAQIIFAAGTTFIKQIQWDAVVVIDPEFAINDAGQCIQYLYEMGESYPSAHCIAEILRELTQKQQAVVLARDLRPHPTEPVVDVTANLNLGSHEGLAYDTKLLPSFLTSENGNTASAHNGPSAWLNQLVEAPSMYSPGGEWSSRGRHIRPNLTAPDGLPPKDISEGKPIRLRATSSTLNNRFQIRKTPKSLRQLVQRRPKEMEQGTKVNTLKDLAPPP